MNQPVFRTMFVRLALLFIAGGAALQSAVATEVPPANRWIPADALIVLEVSKPKAIQEFATGEKATALVSGLARFKALQAGPKYQELMNIVRYLEVSLDTDWRTALAKLTGGGITLAVCPEDTVVLIIDAEDGAMLNRVHEMFLTFARNDAEKADRVVSTQYEDVTAWTFDGEEAHAIIGNRFVLSNRPEGLKSVLELRGKGRNLTSNRNYRAARRAVDADAAASVFADVGLLKQIPPVAAVLKQQNTNPLLALLLAGLLDTVQDSNWLAIGLQIDGDTLDLKARVDGKVSDNSRVAEFAVPKTSTDRALANVSVPRQIAAASFYRDLYRFYAAKDDLFPERTSGLIFFENMMGIFFTGRDLTNEVLAEAEPYVRLVVAEQQYDPAVGTPQVQLPGFALVLRLRDPEAFGPVVEEAWQKAVGLINFTRGQQAQPGLIIDKQTQGKARYTVAYFSTVDIEGKTNLPTRFNLRPSLAMPGPYVVLSSTDGLTRDLIDALETDSAGTPAGTHSLIELEGRSLTSILQANRDALVRNNMVEKGSSQAEAEASIDMLLTLAGLVKHAELGVGVQEGLTQAEVKVQLNFQP